MSKRIPLSAVALVAVLASFARAEFPYPKCGGPLASGCTDPADYERGKAPALYVFGRLAPGATLGDAQSQAETITLRLASAHPALPAQRQLAHAPLPRRSATYRRAPRESGCCNK